VDIIDRGSGYHCEFLNRGGSLIDQNGNTVWRYSEDFGLENIAAGDLEGDGQTNFVAGFAGEGGVVLLDNYGKKKWRQPDGNVWHVEMADIDGSGKPRIVHSNVAGKIIVRDADGNIVSDRELPFYLGQFSLCKWLGGTSQQYGLALREGKIWIFDFRGKVAAEFEAPLSKRAFEVYGARAVLRSDKREYFAAVAEFFSSWSRSVLYVFDSKGNLVYQEVLPQECGAIAAAPIGESGNDAILIGGEESVWRYEFHKR
jgi:hypothetical protein